MEHITPDTADVPDARPGPIEVCGICSSRMRIDWQRGGSYCPTCKT